MKEEKVRTFIAIGLTLEVQAGIAKVQTELKRSAADVKWVDPKSIHITLKFLGEVEKERLVKVSEAVEESLKGFKPFRVKIKGLGAFPTLRNPRVVWVGISEGVEYLKEIKKRLEGSLAPLGFPPEEREFTPHLTLGRIRSPKGREGLVTLLGKEEAVDLGELEVGRVEVMKSELRPQGAVYTSLKEVFLD